MKNYNELSEHGKKLRLRKVIKIGLEQYSLDIETFQFFTEATNMLYKLIDRSGEKYILKIFDEDSSQYEDNIVEAFIIDTCTANSDVPLPEVIPATNGDEIIVIESKYTPIPKRMIIYRWLDGEELDGKETDARFFALGQAMAKLHQATEGIKVPNNIHPKKIDKVYYFKDEKIVYHEKQYKDFVSEKFISTMDKLVPYVDAKLAKMYERENCQLIHGDINPWNIMFEGDTIKIIDFEDVSYGYAIQDIAITLFYYKFDDDFDYEHVKSVLLEGYATVKPLPQFTDEDIEIIILARRLNFLNYILLVSDDPKKYIDRNFKIVEKVISELKIEL